MPMPHIAFTRTILSTLDAFAYAAIRHAAAMPADAIAADIQRLHYAGAVLFAAYFS